MQQLLDAPEVSRLAGEGGAMDVGQGGELRHVVAAEVTGHVAVGAQLPERADACAGQDLAVGQGGLRPALAQPPEVQGLQFVVHEAKYLKQELLRGHGGLSLVSTE